MVLIGTPRLEPQAPMSDLLGYALIDKAAEPGS